MNEKNLSSKEIIEIALLELLKEYDYKDISITKIVEKAGVARVTFYRNYNNIDEVLDYSITKLLNDITKFITITFSQKDPNILRTFITIFLERIMLSKDKLYAIKKSNKRIVFEKISDKFRSVLTENKITNLPLNDKYDNKVKFTIISAVATEWASDGFKDSITDLTEYIVNILIKL